jgi:hypothetical protein
VSGRRQWVWGAVALLAWPAASFAELRLTAPGDPTRQWNVSVETSAGYNDNVNTTPDAGSNRQSSVTYRVSPDVGLRYTRDRTSAQLRYTYAATFYDERPTSKPDEAHLFDASLTHAFTPRLAVNLGDTFRHGVEPELVEQQISGTPLITRRRGSYFYNSLSGGANYQMSTRWTLSLAQSWDRWWFDNAEQAANNDRDEFSTLVSSSYALNPRTFVGGSYRFSQTAYSVSSATNDLRDSSSHAVYATLVRRVNPQVVGQINAGLQFAGFTGATDLSPYVNAGGSYNFGHNSTLAAGFTYSIQLTEVAAYRSANQTAGYVSLHHQFGQKLRGVMTFAYILSTYQNLNPLYKNPNDITQKSSVTETAYRVTAGLHYDFTRWAGLFLNYSYDVVDSDLDNKITGTFRSFDRHQVNSGLRLTY